MAFARVREALAGMGLQYWADCDVVVDRRGGAGHGAGATPWDPATHFVLIDGTVADVARIWLLTLPQALAL